MHPAPATFVFAIALAGGDALVAYRADIAPGSIASGRAGRRLVLRRIRILMERHDSINSSLYVLLFLQCRKRLVIFRPRNTSQECE